MLTCRACQSLYAFCHSYDTRMTGGYTYCSQPKLLSKRIGSHTFFLAFLDKFTGPAIIMTAIACVFIYVPT